MNTSPTASLNSLEIHLQGLGTCISSNFLTVPKYQRAFSWDDENVANFLADINTAYTNKAPEYFMGSVVLQGTDKKYEVVDGQQRITTATILIAATRDFLVSKGMVDVAKSVESSSLQAKSTWSQQDTPRLTLSMYDNDFFIKAILGNAPTLATRESHERLLAAKQRCQEFLESISKHFNNWFDHIEGIITYLEHKARVIQVTVPSQATRLSSLRRSMIVGRIYLLQIC